MGKFNTAWRRLRRGNVSGRAIALETQRRIRVALARRRERASLTELDEKPAQLTEAFARLSAADLLEHFQSRAAPTFFPGFASPQQTAELQKKLFPEETEGLLIESEGIVGLHSWPLLGVYGRNFDTDGEINWHTDPLSGKEWPPSYHADIKLLRNDGSDVRVLWELNRLGHFITLGRAYAFTKDEKFSVEFFRQLARWRAQNPVGCGVNWSCAMEVALRAINLLAGFVLFLRSPGMNPTELGQLLKMFDQHGSHIKRNLEFSYLGTSNHYLSDVIGLLWLGVMLPELKAASEWRAWGLAELLRELDKQILEDGADYEGSTGYHSFVAQLFLYSFVLCRAHKIEIADRYWSKLHGMLVYLRSVLRPDGLMPLVGDTDGGQFLPIVSRDANDRAFLLAVGAAVLKDSQFKLPGHETPPELLWLLGEDGLRDFEQLDKSGKEISSQAFPDAGTYVLRDADLYLSINANGARQGRPASHRHNDALSIEVSTGGRAFIVDPGTYVYTANLPERQRFRSTAYHSTVQIDDEDQQTTNEDEPFSIGAESKVRVLSWESTNLLDRVVAEHVGYERLLHPVTHRRSVTFDKTNRWWSIEDELVGNGNHAVAARFHFDADVAVSLFDERSVLAKDADGYQLLVITLSPGSDLRLTVEPQFVSRNYGSKLPSTTACWSLQTDVPCKLGWAILPVGCKENLEERLKALRNLTSKVGQEV